jgi:hypothetical protein
MRCICILVFDLKNAFPLLRIINMSILRCVFLYRESGRRCRSRTAIVSGPDRKYFPVKTGGLENRFWTLRSDAAGTGWSSLARAG